MDKPTDWRALCAELLEIIEGEYEGSGCCAELRLSARAALAQPEPEGPSESDVTELFYRHVGEGSEVGFENAIEEALARWGRPAIKPVPVSERLPGPEDCDEEGRCWWWDDDDDKWCLHEHSPRILCWTHWLPHHALPVPAILTKNN